MEYPTIVNKLNILKAVSFFTIRLLTVTYTRHENVTILFTVFSFYIQQRSFFSAVMITLLLLLLLHNFYRWKFLNGAELLSNALSVLFKFQVYVIHDMSLKFGIANSLCQMRCCIMDYLCNLLLRSLFSFYISASVANKLHHLRQRPLHKCQF